MAQPPPTPRSGTQRRDVDNYLLSLKLSSLLRTVGDCGVLASRALVVATRRPYSWVGDAVMETSLALQRCLVPMALSLFVYVAGFGVILFGNVVTSLGLVDREPGTIFLIFIREIGLWVSMMVFAGVAGSAITADLGARKARDELDALRVLGVDTLRSLVVPRIVAMTFAGGILVLLAAVVTLSVNYVVAPLTLHVSPALFRDQLLYNLFPVDLFSAVIRGLIIGFLVGVISCQKGLTSAGGAEGVGRAVNQTVMVSFVTVWVLNSLFNTAVLPLFPETSLLRG